MIKLTTAFAMLVMMGSAFAQGTPDMMQPPAEVKQASFLVGEWSAELTFFEMGGTTAKSTGHVSSKMTLMGRFVSSTFKTTVPGMGDMEGLQLLTYDSDAKKWHAWWYDNMSSYAMVFRGTMENGKLLMVSDPTPMPGMGDVVMRTLFEKKSDTEVFFRLEMKVGDDWMKFIEGNYKKK
jgi:hypothetical protein